MIHLGFCTAGRYRKADGENVKHFAYLAKIKPGKRKEMKQK